MGVALFAADIALEHLRLRNGELLAALEVLVQEALGAAERWPQDGLALGDAAVSAQRILGAPNKLPRAGLIHQLVRAARVAVTGWQVGGFGERHPATGRLLRACG